VNDSSVRLSALKFLNISVNGVNGISLVDLGPKFHFWDKLNVESCEFIEVRGAFSDPIPVPLVRVAIKSCSKKECENVAGGTSATCAVAPLKGVKHDVVLPLDVANEVQKVPTGKWGVYRYIRLVQKSNVRSCVIVLIIVMTVKMM